MLDIKFIRQNPDKVKKACKDKGIEVDIDRILELDQKRKEILKLIEKIRAQKNKASKEIVKIKDQKEKEKIVSEMRKLDKKEEEAKENLKIVDKEFEELMLQVPNLPLEDVPIGKDETENVVQKEWGEKPKFDFAPKDYLEIAEKLDLIDVKRAAKVAGSRFGYLKREAVWIEFALIYFALETLTKEGFVPLLPPVMLKPEMARGTGYFEASDIEEAYFLPKDNLFLIGTSEQSILTMHANEIFEERELPKRYLAFSTCFRREAGSWGKDTRGIFRVHQFDKLEMFSFCKPEDSKKEHELFLSLEEKLMQSLNIPYRVLKICTGDLGRPAAAKYDIEAWFPSQNRYRETHSTSNCTDFQARRLNIRYRKKDGKLEFVHTVNGTAFSQRPILAILENYQQADGSVKIPEVLQKYLPFKEIRNHARKRNCN
jgi:seryl-tRNA synthetase